MSNNVKEMVEPGNAEGIGQSPLGTVDRFELLPMTSPFGLRAAALAGLVVTAGLAVAGTAEQPGGGIAPTLPVCSRRDPVVL
ncbi:hypothetical protein ALI144C_09805 [Actinosynnema sp. ALI-1.44]|uniref:hypothetical protein n=1 Tax=Actinosynnema sp. ALI-1.44 TaxID=1933779 RepID=UPI00097C2B42|nr:hypothetical protein [Actinosynnema sp. ALI-1.44]ONI86938.1 hypothetical protein ALI144C_09805 [Actinosynnema sp. ALI-1.44]